MALAPDDSHEMDMVVVFRSSNHDAEMESMQIHAVLQSSAIPSVLVGPSTLPVLEFEVLVPSEQRDQAERVIAEARAAGPAAAAEAEAASEEPV
jgi:hypothetical protein